MTDDKVYTGLAANTVKAKLANHFKWTRLVTPSTDKHYLLRPGAFHSQKITLACIVGLCFDEHP